MKHKIFTGLVCSISILGLAACGTNEETTSSKGEKVKQEEKKDIKATESSKALENPQDKKGDDTKIIGCISFNLIVRGIYQSCVLSYKLDKAELNKGYTTEALRKAIQVAFGEFQLHRIEAPIMPRNLASIQVVTKIGFQYEGVSRKMLMVNGVWEDH
ncbi:GNAT family N-acetyltransferase, partial [Bacillus sp. SS-TM]